MSRPLLTIYVLWSIWALLWIGSAWWSSPTERRPSRGGDVLHQLMTFLGLAALLVVTRLRHGLLAPLWRLDDSLEWTMAVATVLGFVFACWARLILGTLWSVRVERKENHRIIARGPYAIVRHPIYTGLITAALATALVKATPLALFGFVLVSAGLAIKARLEERFLAAELGEASYAEYRGRVPMLVPFLRLWSRDRARS
jgi:protein-S-isoprenylcysteine O-methyltransferase Ste14